MTYEGEAPVRRASVGTKVLVFACSILAVLGSFWGIVWFIRAYVEAPRVSIPAPIILAASESKPAPAPPKATERQSRQDDTTASVRLAAAPGQAIAAPQAVAAPSRPAEAPAPAIAQAAAPEPAGQALPASSLADRWGPVNDLAVRPGAPLIAPPAAPAEKPAMAAPAEPPPTASAPAALATNPPANDPPIEEVAEGNVPAIAGPAPLPRRKPTITAAAKRTDPPLPRPRPDGPAPQSVWTGVPSSDERFSGQN